MANRFSVRDILKEDVIVEIQNYLDEYETTIFFRRCLK